MQSSPVATTTLFYLTVLIAISLPTAQGFKCYEESCAGTGQGRPCRTDSRDFPSAQTKLNCPTGCKYSTTKDESGRPVANQPFKIRTCWDSYYDGGHKYTAGTCTETRQKGRVDRVCVCSEDWCNGPEQDREFDESESMNSSPARYTGGGPLTISLLVVVVALAKVMG